MLEITVGDKFDNLPIFPFSEVMIGPERPIFFGVKMAKNTLPISLGTAIASTALVYKQEYSLVKSVIIVVLAGYVPSLFNGAEYDGTAYADWLVRWNKKMFNKESERYIFASHPHGVASMHHMGTMMLPAVCEAGAAFEDLNPQKDRRELAASILFKLPVLRTLSLMAGAVDADRKVASRMLKEGKNLGILVGGEQEQLLSRYGEHTAFIKSRKGFIKLALRFQVPVVPCYCFGETDLYHQSGMFLSFRQWFAKKFGIALVLSVGRSWLFPFLPIADVKLIQVVGDPIYPSKLKGEEPSVEEIDAMHSAYMAGLVTLFDENKESCGYPNARLVLV